MSRVSVLTALLFLMAVALAGSLRAQEVEVAFDKAGTITRIDAEQARHLGLFSEYEGFVAARLFEFGDGRYELMVEYRGSDGRLMRERETLTASELAALRERVSERVAERGGGPLDQEGRFEMLVTTTVAGGYYGALVPAALGVETENAYTAVPAIGAAAGFFFPFFWTQEREVTEAQATFTRFGLMSGAMHGGGLALLLGGESPGDQAAAASTLLFSTAEGIAGYRLAARPELTAGVGEAMSAGSYFGAGFGVLTSLMLVEDVLGLNDDIEADVFLRTVGGLGVAGSIGGAYAGYRWARHAGFTQGDTRVWSTSGLVGALAGTTLLSIFDVLSPTAASLVMMGTTTGGLIVGGRLVRDRDFTEWQGNIIRLGTYGGFLFGLGMAAAMDTEDEAAFTLTLLGTAVGLGLIYSAYAEEARGSAAGSSFDLRLQPGGFISLLGDGVMNSARAPHHLPPSLVSLRWGF